MRKMKRKKLRAIQTQKFETTHFEQVVRGDIWDVVCDSPAEAAQAREKASTMMWVVDQITARHLTPAEAAQLLGVTLKRIRLLQLGRFSRFSSLEIQRMADVMSTMEGPTDSHG